MRLSLIFACFLLFPLTFACEIARLYVERKFSVRDKSNFEYLFSSTFPLEQLEWSPNHMDNENLF